MCAQKHTSTREASPSRICNVSEADREHLEDTWIVKPQVPINRLEIPFHGHQDQRICSLFKVKNKWLQTMNVCKLKQALNSPMHADNDRSALISRTWTQRALYFTEWWDRANMHSGITLSWTRCADEEKLKYILCLTFTVSASPPFTPRIDCFSS